MILIKRKKYNPEGIHSSKTSIFYLYEVYAIPKEIRDEYSDKLAKRKNSENQKNVRLLKIIFEKVQNEDFYSWNVGSICKIVGFKTANQLYWYKSRILKDLREMYFNWKKIEKELENNIKVKSKIGIAHAKAQRMYEIGMVKEAKAIFLEISKIYECKNEKNSKRKDYLMLSEVYENLLNYYSSKKDIKRFSIFHKKLKSLYNLPKNVSLSDKDRIFIKIRMLKAEDNRISFHFYSPLHAEEKISVIKEILYFSEKFSIIKYRIWSLYRLASVILVNFQHSEEKKKEAYKYLLEGWRLSKQYKLKEPENAFRAELLLRKFEPLGESGKEKEILKFEELYEKNKIINPTGKWTIRCLDVFIASLAHLKDERYAKMLNEFTKLKILQSEISATVFHLYIGRSSSEKSDLLNLAIQQVNSSYLLIQNEADSEEIKRAETTSHKVIKILGNTYMQNIRIFVLLDLLYYEFLRGKDFDLDNVYSLVRKIHRMQRSNELLNSIVKNSFELLKTGLTMFEESQKYNAKDKVLDKYLKKFSDLCDEIMRKDYYHYNLGYLYLHMTFIARTIGYKEIWAIVEKQWKYMQEHHPAIVESFLKLYHDQEEKRKAA